MELIDNLQQAMWSRGDPRKETGYRTFRVLKYLPSEVPGAGNYTYALFDDEGNVVKVNLIGGDEHSDPLSGLLNVQLKLKGKNEIIGIIAEDDCAVLKT